MLDLSHLTEFHNIYRKLLIKFPVLCISIYQHYHLIENKIYINHYTTYCFDLWSIHSVPKIRCRWWTGKEVLINVGFIVGQRMFLAKSQTGLVSHIRLPHEVPCVFTMTFSYLTSHALYCTSHYQHITCLSELACP